MLMLMVEFPTHTFATFFYNLSSSLFLFFIFFHFTSIFLAKLFTFFGGNPFHQRSQDGYEFPDDEAVEEEFDYFAVKPVHGCSPAAFVNRDEYDASFDEEASYDNGDEEESSYATPASSKTTSDDDDDGDGEEEEEEEEIIAVDTESSYDSETNEAGPTSGFRETSGLASNGNNLRQGRSFDANVTC